MNDIRSQLAQTAMKVSQAKMNNRDLMKTVNQISSGTKNQNSDNQDNIYYNIIIRNTDEEEKELKFSENRTVPILDIPSNYELACVRAFVPSFNIPLLFFPETNFFVKLKYGAVEVQKDLVYIPNATFNPYANINKLPVYDFSEITQSLNNALQDAKTDLDALAPTAAFDFPFMTYDAPSQLFTLNAEIAGYDESLGTGNYIEIYFSARLFEYYANLQDFFVSDNETRIIVRDTFDNETTFNGKPYYKMTQSQPTLELFNDIQKLVFLSNTLPVVPELQPSQEDVTRRAFFDLNVTGIADKSGISFFPQGPLRYYSLISDYPLKQVDCEIRWESKTGETFPIFISKDSSASLKLLFQKRIALRLDIDE